MIFEKSTFLIWKIGTISECADFDFGRFWLTAWLTLLMERWEDDLWDRKDLKAVTALETVYGFPKPPLSWELSEVWLLVLLRNWGVLMGVPLGVEGAVLWSEGGTFSVYSGGGSMPLSKERWGWKNMGIFMIHER